MALIEDACIFHIAKGVGIDDCCVGFERVDCIAEDLTTGERMNVRVITFEDDLSDSNTAAQLVNADDVRD